MVLGRNYTHMEKILAKIYLYMLPIRMFSQLEMISMVLAGAGRYFDVIINLIGLFLILIRQRGKMYFENSSSTKLLKYFVLMIIFLNLSSIVMAVVIQTTYGNYAGESAFSGILGMIIYLIQYVFIFLYNREVFSMLSKDKVLNILQKVCYLLLGLGYWQLLVMLYGGVFSKIYDVIDIFDILPDVTAIGKLSLTGTEGASAGTLIGVFVFPFLLSQILIGKNKIKNIVQILLWLPVIYFTKSSTAYISVFTVLIIFFWLIRKNKRGKSIIPIIICTIFLIIFVVPNSLSKVLPDEVSNNIEYLLFEKVTDLENGSTASRMVPFVTNFGAFTEYPILGVGNGLQGYFYQKYFPSWAKDAPGSDIEKFLSTSKETIVNGGIFFPSLLSGYGIIGCFFIIIYIARSTKLVIKAKEELKDFYYIYVISGFAILVAGFQGELAGLYYVWFILSIPYMIKKETSYEKSSIN